MCEEIHNVRYTISPRGAEDDGCFHGTKSHTGRELAHIDGCAFNLVFGCRAHRHLRFPEVKSGKSQFFSNVQSSENAGTESITGLHPRDLARD